MRLLTPLLTLLAPHDCVGCGDEGMLLCLKCRPKLKMATAGCYHCRRLSFDFMTCTDCRQSSALLAVYPAVQYSGAAKDLVWKLKFGRAQAAAQVMADMMLPLLADTIDRHVVITHAPTATTRVRQRGYDQAALIAQSLARQSGLPYRELLRRHGNQKQIGASRSGRLSQLHNAFRPVHSKYMRGKTVVLIDDVVTTGATLQTAAAALQAAGARQVLAVTFARA